MKWTKKEINACIAQLDTIWLTLRSPSFVSAVQDRDDASAYRALVQKVGHVDIVLSGLRSMREMHARRYRECCETIGNQIVRFTRWGRDEQPKSSEPAGVLAFEIVSDELVVRFTRAAREEDKTRAMYEALVLRVVREGLPDEVKAYDPTTAKR